VTTSAELESEDAYSKIVYNYETAFHCFTAHLDDDEAERMAECSGGRLLHLDGRNKNKEKKKGKEIKEIEV
jgi:hypothetical protein